MRHHRWTKMTLFRHPLSTRLSEAPGRNYRQSRQSFSENCQNFESLRFVDDIGAGLGERKPGLLTKVTNLKMVKHSQHSPSVGLCFIHSLHCLHQIRSSSTPNRNGVSTGGSLQRPMNRSSRSPGGSQALVPRVRSTVRDERRRGGASREVLRLGSLGRLGRLVLEFTNHLEQQIDPFDLCGLPTSSIKLFSWIRWVRSSFPCRWKVCSWH